MSDEHRCYTAGFMFLKGRVLLVRKNHPKWQVGMMNAVGGEVEGGESLLQCMMREFHEEANYLTDRWQYFCAEFGPGYEVHFFRLFADSKLKYTPPKTNDKGEELEWCDPHGVKFPVIGNLNWLLPLAFDPRQIDCTVRTTGDIRKVVTW
jgi:8-oxo-dGTP pyrophosphatase MutT (NUDIX family)